MVKPFSAVDPLAVCCPACGARIKAAPSSRRRRVRCPKCREAIDLEPTTDPAPEAPQPAAPPADETARQRARIEALEARVAALEKALAGAERMAAPAEVVEEKPAPQVPATPVPESAAAGTLADLPVVLDEPPADFSGVQAELLRRCLAPVTPHRITIQFAAGDATARRRAEWFKAVFESATWTVQGPEPSPIQFEGPCICFAACIPVSFDVGATYLALRAAGFHLTSHFDPYLTDREERLTVG